MLASYVEPKTGALVRSDTSLRDAAVLLRMALDALHVLHPAHAQPGVLSSTDVQRVLLQSNAQQRMAALAAIRQLTDLADQVRGTP